MRNYRVASSAELVSVLPMMREFYDFERIPFEEERATVLLRELLGDPRNGRLVMIESEDATAGYMIVGFGFSIEFGGRDALLDELFILPEFRGVGLGTGAINFAVKLCAENGISALHLEADHFNDRAHDLYLRLGFKDHERHLMTKWLA